MSTVQAYRIRIRGLVQGAGFRSCVHAVASRLGLSGSVTDDAQGVLVHLEGDDEAVDTFIDTLRREAPPPSRIDAIVTQVVEATETLRRPPCADHAVQAPEGPTSPVPDRATCPACLAELFDPTKRRYRYAFTHCRRCGPGHLFLRHLPEDRKPPIRSDFAMCPACAAEFDDPESRRFHTPSVSCPDCGPKLVATDAHGVVLTGDPLDIAATAIQGGRIVALKSPGGFHLVCDARNAAALATLRNRLKCPEAPLTVMLMNILSIRAVASTGSDEENALLGPAHPVVLVRKGPESDSWTGVADGLTEIGLRLPHAPVHWLLLHALCGHPEGLEWTRHARPDIALAMTATGPEGVPIAQGNAAAYRELRSCADVFVVHEGGVRSRCGDSVLRHVAGGMIHVHRARGLSLRPIASNLASVPTLALGNDAASAFAISRGPDVYLSPCLGDLRNRATPQVLEPTIESFRQILGIGPRLYACDAQPDLVSSRLAKRSADRDARPLYPIHHHAAHVGVVMAELGRRSPTLGLVLDGPGAGPGDVLWGGELLLVDATGFSRPGHLEELPLPGGDRAIREPWRIGASVLSRLGHPDEVVRRWPDEPSAKDIAKLAGNPRLARSTDSLECCFDGVASLLGLCDHQTDAGHATRRLDALASTRPGHVRTKPFDATMGEELPLDGLLAALLTEPDKAQAAADFLRTLAHTLAVWVDGRARAIGYTGPVALTGTCLLNRPLAEGLVHDLGRMGWTGVFPRSAPLGDDGLALGQLWLASSAFAAGAHGHVFRR